MNIYIEHLLRAISNVDSKYFSGLAYNIEGDTPNIKGRVRSEYVQRVERVFAYEFYHQFRIMMEKEENKKYYQDLMLNSEITKLGTNQLIKDGMTIIPDIVLHKGQESIQKNHQILFIEVKANNKMTQAQVNKDLEKCSYAINRLNFQYAIFIAINIDYNNVIEKCKKYMKNNPDNIYKNIYLFQRTGWENGKVISFDKIK